MAYTTLKYSKAIITYFILCFSMYLISFSTLEKLFESANTILLFMLYPFSLCILTCFIYKYNLRELGLVCDNFVKSVIQGIIIGVGTFLIAQFLKDKYNLSCGGCIDKNLFVDDKGFRFFSPNHLDSFNMVSFFTLFSVYFFGVIIQEFVKSFMRISLKNVFINSFHFPIFASAFCLNLFHMHLTFTVTLFMLPAHILWSYMQHFQKNIYGSIAAHIVTGMLMLHFFAHNLFFGG